MTKFCVDCKHYDKGVVDTWCRRPYPNSAVSPVSGKRPMRFGESCLDQRSNSSYKETCGSEARYWEPNLKFRALRLVGLK